MKKNLLIYMLLLCAGFVSAQSLISYNQSPSYYMVERSDIRRYDNGKFSGLTSREVRSFISPVEAPANAASALKNNNWFSGHFYVLEETKSNMQKTARGLSGSVPSLFHIAPDGTMTVVNDNGFPSYRSFPSFPGKPVSPGDSWRSQAVRAVDPYNTGIYTRLPIYVEYVFAGEEVYKGEDVYRIRAKWATRYGVQYTDYSGDPSLQSATGTHDADILVLKDTGAAILIRDVMDETFFYKDGSSVRLAGSTLLFTEFPPAVNKDTVYTALKELSGQDSIASVPQSTSLSADNTGIIKTNSVNAGIGADGTAVSTDKTPSLESSIVVEQLETGIRLSVRDIRFVSDSAQILSEEQWRLDEIAKVLRLVHDSFFLVEGHTASTGNPSGEKKLSVERAKKIISEMVKRGISEERFLYAGYGAENPVADNATSEGRAQNRRVEITILE